MPSWSKVMELVEELERVVRVSPNEHLRKFAAGTLFNTVEALQQDFDSKDATRKKGEESSEGDAPKKGLMGKAGSFLGKAFEESADAEIELSEEVLEELALRESELADERARQEDAASLIQSLHRQNKTRRAFRMLRGLAAAVRVVAHAIRVRRQRRRAAALFCQARFRAYICESRGMSRFDHHADHRADARSPRQSPEADGRCQICHASPRGEAQRGRATSGNV